MKDYAKELGIPDERVAATGIPRGEVNRFIQEHLEWRREHGDNTELRINNQPMLPPTPWTAHDAAEKKKQGKKNEESSQDED